MRKMDAYVKYPHISLKTAAYATKICSHLHKRLETYAAKKRSHMGFTYATLDRPLIRKL